MPVWKSAPQQTLPIPESIGKQVAWLRLVDQIQWYDDKSKRSQRLYKALKIIQLFLAVSIPLATSFPQDAARWFSGAAGSLIALLEGVQHMNQYSTLWVMYRSTAEYLKHEKFLFLSGAGPYKGISLEEQIVLLAERVEERVSAEHANWFNETKRVAQPQKAIEGTR